MAAPTPARVIWPDQTRFRSGSYRPWNRHPIRGEWGFSGRLALDRVQFPGNWVQPPADTTA
jgi:hypothetical protein